MTERLVINNKDSGLGSLRDAILKAQSGDIIKFNSTLTGGNTITLTTGQLEIPVGKNLIIDGIDNPNLVISGDNKFRVFYLNSTSVKPTSLSLKNLMINNGYTPERGGGVSTTHQGILKIDRVKFNDNVADKGGGAVFSAFEGNLTVNNSQFNRNKAIAENDERGAGAIAFWGPKNITVTNSRFVSNEGINGGAINSLNGKLTIINSTFLNNKTTAAVYGTGEQNPSLRGFGGAVFADRASAKDEPSGTIRIVNSRFQGNTALGQGGAANLFTGTQDNVIFESNVFINNQVLPLPGGNKGNGGAVVQTSNGLNKGFMIRNTAFINNTATNQGGGIWMMDAPTTITNSTFSGNRAEATTVQGNGGAMMLYGPTNIINSTIADNYAGWAGGGVSAPSDKTITVQNTIFSQNTAFNGGNSWNILQHTNRTFNGLGGNIQWPGNPNQTGNQYDATTNIVKVDPKLDTLINVSKTYIYPLLSGSPAIDTGANNSLKIDQRKQPRPIDGDQNGTLIIDSGAYEFSMTPLSQVNNSSQSGILKNDVLLSNQGYQQIQNKFEGNHYLDEKPENDIQIGEIGNNFIKGEQEEDALIGKAEKDQSVIPLSTNNNTILNFKIDPKQMPISEELNFEKSTFIATNIDHNEEIGHLQISDNSVHFLSDNKQLFASNSIVNQFSDRTLLSGF